MKRLFFFLLLVLGMGWLLQDYFFLSEESILRQKAKTLISIASVHGVESRLQQIKRVKKISGFFTENVLLVQRQFSNSIAIKRELVRSKKGLEEKLFLMRSRLELAHCNCHIEELQIKEEQATMIVKAKIYWQKIGKKERFYETIHVQIDWKKRNGEWLIYEGKNVSKEE